MQQGNKGSERKKRHSAKYAAAHKTLLAALASARGKLHGIALSSGLRALHVSSFGPLEGRRPTLFNRAHEVGLIAADPTAHVFDPVRHPDRRVEDRGVRAKTGKRKQGTATKHQHGA